MYILLDISLFKCFAVEKTIVYKGLKHCEMLLNISRCKIGLAFSTSNYMKISHNRCGNPLIQCLLNYYF